MPIPVPSPVARKTRSEMNRAEPWKEDGNIVLAAEGKCFRVHRSILSAYSEVFKDMFDCPHSSKCEKELIGNCPVVRLHDAATDIQIILKAMYDRSYPSPCYEEMPISVVSAFLRLGEKYDIPALTNEAKAKLCCAFEPTSLSSASLLTSSFRYDLFPAIIGGDPQNFQLMNLLQEMDLKAPLPIAMYQCIISCPLADIVDGYRAMDSFYALSRPNLQSFIRMKDIFERYRLALAKNLTTSPSCKSSKCVCNTRRLWSEDINAVPPFEHWTSLTDKLFCGACISSLKTKREAEMDKAWDQVPTAFGFNSWAEVKKSGNFPSFTIHAC